jgi:xylose isomerase
MRTYLILKEKAAQFGRDAEIQALLAEITAEDEEMNALSGIYSAKKAKDLKAFAFDRQAMGGRGLKYERLDQLTVELIMGVR